MLQLRILCAIAAGGLAVSAASAAPTAGFQPNHTEELLAAAGFQAVPANTPERAAQLGSLDPHRLIAQPNGATFTYVYADPQGCQCLYMGDSQDVQAFEQLTSKERIAHEYANAAAARDTAAFDWDLWGPYPGWAWAGPVFIHGGFGGHRHH